MSVSLNGSESDGSSKLLGLVEFGSVVLLDKPSFESKKLSKNSKTLESNKNVRL